MKKLKNLLFLAGVFIIVVIFSMTTIAAPNIPVQKNVILQGATNVETNMAEVVQGATNIETNMIESGTAIGTGVTTFTAGKTITCLMNNAATNGTTETQNATVTIDPAQKVSWCQNLISGVKC